MSKFGAFLSSTEDRCLKRPDRLGRAGIVAGILAMFVGIFQGCSEKCVCSSSTFGGSSPERLL